MPGSEDDQGGVTTHLHKEEHQQYYQHYTTSLKHHSLLKTVLHLPAVSNKICSSCIYGIEIIHCITHLILQKYNTHRRICKPERGPSAKNSLHGHILGGGGCVFRYTYRVLVAECALNSAVHFSNLDISETRKFLLGKIFPCWSEILTVTTPRQQDNTRVTSLTNCWQPGFETHFQSRV